MTDAHTEVVVAGRHLLQWGRTRQNVWHDPSQDLLAALGSRYASFDSAFNAEPAPPASHAPRQGELPGAQIGPTPVPPPLATLPPPPVFAPLPSAPAFVPVAPPTAPPITLAPVVPVPPAATVAERKPQASAWESSHVAAPAPALRSRWLSPVRVGAVAAVILASVASPALWRAYESLRVAPVTSNTVTIESTPPGSVVLIDGTEAGKTPFTTTVPLGAHRVELRHRKKVHTLDLQVMAGEPVVARVDWSKVGAAPTKRASAKPPKSTKPTKTGKPAAAGPASGAAPSAETPTAMPDSGEPADAPASSPEPVDVPPSSRPDA